MEAGRQRLIALCSPVALLCFAQFLTLSRGPAPLASSAPAGSAPSASAPSTGAAAVSTISGDWQGALEVGGAKLRLALHLVRTPEGPLKATLDSLDQGAMGIPVETATFEDGTLRLALTSLGARFEGKLGKDAAEIAGTWTQGPTSLPLTLSRAVGGAAAGRAPGATPAPS